MVDPEPDKELRRRIPATISGWDCPLLSFIYLGLNCGTNGTIHGIAGVTFLPQFHFEGAGDVTPKRRKHGETELGYP